MRNGDNNYNSNNNNHNFELRGALIVTIEACEIPTQKKVLCLCADDLEENLAVVIAGINYNCST